MAKKHFNIKQGELAALVKVARTTFESAMELVEALEASKKTPTWMVIKSARAKKTKVAKSSEKRRSAG